MKKTILICLFLISVHFSFSQYYNTSVLENGTYNATVDYKNLSTGHSAKYSLSVVVVEDRVVQINFDNGGNISSNSRNIQTYSGGRLEFGKDYSGNIVSASTTVIVVEMNGNRVSYTIYLG